MTINFKNKEHIAIDFLFLMTYSLYLSNNGYNVNNKNDYYYYLNQFYYLKKQYKLILENINMKD